MSQLSTEMFEISSRNDRDFERNIRDFNRNVRFLAPKIIKSCSVFSKQNNHDLFTEMLELWTEMIKILTKMFNILTDFPQHFNCNI